MYSPDSSDYMWSSPLHDPSNLNGPAAHPSSFADVVLVFAGVFLQACTSGDSKALHLLNFVFMGGSNFHHANADHQGSLELPFDLELFGFLCGWLRSLFAMILLIVVRKFVMANLSPVLVPRRLIPHDGHWMLTDLLFHLQCRFLVGTALCLLPAESVSPVTTNFLVLVASTLSQPVFKRELQSAARRRIRVV